MVIGCGLLVFMAELSTSLILYIALCHGLSWCHAHKEKHSRFSAWQFLLFWLCLVMPTTCVTYLLVTQWAGNICQAWAKAESCSGKVAPFCNPPLGSKRFYSACVAMGQWTCPGSALPFSTDTGIAKGKGLSGHLLRFDSFVVKVFIPFSLFYLLLSDINHLNSRSFKGFLFVFFFAVVGGFCFVFFFLVWFLVCFWFFFFLANYLLADLV